MKHIFALFVVVFAAFSPVPVGALADELTERGENSTTAHIQQTAEFVNSFGGVGGSDVSAAAIPVLEAPVAALQAARAGIAVPEGAGAIVGAPEFYEGELPVRVADKKLEDSIRAGANPNVSIAHLEACGMIYSNGSFLWDVPDAGIEFGSNQPTCVAEIYMKAAPEGQAPGGPNDKLVAIAHVPAGGSIKCNIDAFPQTGYQPAAGEVTFPHDQEPTMEEVVAVMDREQKQNAAMKSISAAVVGGVGMYLATKDNDKKATTYIAAAAGAAGAGGMAYASTQTGKVVGDTIMGAGMNTVAGAVMGNMGAGMGSTGEVLVIRDCDKPKSSGSGDSSSSVGSGGKCLWGYVTKGGQSIYKDVPASNNYTNSKYVHGIAPCYYDINKNAWCVELQGTEIKIEDARYTKVYGLYNVVLEGFDGKMADLANLRGPDWGDKVFGTSGSGADKKGVCMHMEGDKAIIGPKATCGGGFETNVVKIESAYYKGSRRMAMMKGVTEGIEGKTFGLTLEDYENPEKNIKTTDVVGRNADGTENGETFTEAEVSNFRPMTQDSSDGGVVDFENKARMKGTLIGAGAGGALGGLSAYQGAKSEIEERYIVALQEYEGSLRKVYCMTGSRFLKSYNDTVVIPNMK
jgi:hypothetical protein